jgi:uncharacterized protein YjaG (DUF416 family)
MKVNGFDKAAFLAEIITLSGLQRSAYAIACAERLLPLYDWFEATESWGDGDVLRRGIDTAWSWVKCQVDAGQIASAISACEAVVPDTEEFSSGLASRGLDAASATVQALETCLNPLPETVLEAGEIAWECAFGVEQSHESPPGGAYIADAQTLAKLSRGSFVLLEEKIQRQSLEALHELDLTDEAVEAFRERYGKLAVI